MIINVTGGPSFDDPTDIAPLSVYVDGRFVKLIARTWRSRLAIWLLRQYVEKILAGSR